MTTPAEFLGIESVSTGLPLSIMAEAFAICRLAPNQEVPEWATRGEFYSITRTQDEISVVCADANVPEGILCDRGWRGLKVEAQLDFSLTGVLESLAEPLARAGISIFSVSTYETDHLLVKEADLERSVVELSRAGHMVAQFRA